MNRSWLLAALAALALTACDDGDSPSDPDQTPRPDAAADADTDSAIVVIDAGPERDLGEDPDTGPMPDAEVDRSVDPPPTPVEDCADACGRYAACERLEIFGDYDGCLDACARASRREPPTGWFECLEFESCGLLQLCRLPEPPALSCAEVCTGLETCGVELPFPDCEAECALQNGANDTLPFSRCGEAVVDVCNPDGWWQCAGEDVYAACQRRCDVSIDCNLVRPAGCLQACIGERFADDPLARRRGEQRTQCVGFAGNDCQRIDACLNPQPVPVPPDQATFCRAWDSCLADFGIPCEEAFLIEQDSPGFLDCAYDQIRNGCPPDPFLVLEGCFGGGGPRGPGCAELCEARDICGDLPAGQNRQGCLTECNDAITFGSDDARQRQEALFPCGIAESCDALALCLGDNSPVAACEAHCTALVGCGLAGDDCEETCNAEFFRARRIGYRDCVSAAGDDCAAIGACELGEPIGCIERCDRLNECGLDDQNCLSLCDDESYVDPAAAAARLACVMTAPLCFRGRENVEVCQRNADVAGAACLGWCRAQTGCDADDVSGLVECVVSCGEGLRGVDGERFAAAKGCIERAGAGAGCAVLDACIPAAGVLDCDGWCGPLESCDVAPADCGVVCEDDPLARWRQADQGECLDDAGANACGAVRACIAGDEVGGPIDPAALCAQYRACGLDDFIPCEEVINFGDGTLQCVADLINPCPPDPFIIFEQCFIDGPENVVSTLAPCRGLCEVRARCAALDDSIRDCTAACVDEVEARPEELEAALLPCGASLTCGDYAACFAANDPANACGEHCAALAACGVAPADCEAQCAADFFRDRQMAWRQCVVRAAGECGAVAACDPGEVYGCEAQCARLAGCGQVPFDCERACDDAAFADASGALQTLACIVSAPLCNQGSASVAVCTEDRTVAGGACLGFCRAETGCDPEAGEALAACVVACGEGLAGDDGIRFAVARDCLDGVDALGACGALAACIPAEAPVDCAGWCGPLEACAAAPDACDVICPDDELARLRASVQPACLAAAGGACGEVLACLDPAPDVLPPVDVDVLCRLFDRCGFQDFGLFCQDFIQEFDDAGRRCLQENLAVCPRDPFELFELCLDGQGSPGELAACQQLCEAQGRCGLIDGPMRDCASECTAAVARSPGGLRAALLPCGTATSCGDLAACIEENGPAGQCRGVCDAAVACGAFADDAACLAACGDVLLGAFVPPGYLDGVAACLDGLAGAACAAEGAACFVVEQGDCEQACGVIFECGLGDGGIDQCVVECSQDPAAAPVIGCIIEWLQPPDRCDIEAVDQCIQELGIDGGEPVDPPQPPRR